MTRQIVLKLAEDTTETECGSCPHEEQSKLVPFAHVCRVTRHLLPVLNDRSCRTKACLAAEHEAARMVAIEPSTVALFIESYDETDCPSVITDGTPIEHALAVIKTMGALRQHGSKAR